MICLRHSFIIDFIIWLFVTPFCLFIIIIQTILSKIFHKQSWLKEFIDELEQPFKEYEIDGEIKK